MKYPVLPTLTESEGIGRIRSTSRINSYRKRQDRQALMKVIMLILTNWQEFILQIDRSFLKKTTWRVELCPNFLFCPKMRQKNRLYQWSVVQKLALFRIWLRHGYKPENLVYPELRRAGYDVYAGSLRDKGVDFVAKRDIIPIITVEFMQWAVRIIFDNFSLLVFHFLFLVFW